MDLLVVISYQLNVNIVCFRECGYRLWTYDGWPIKQQQQQIGTTVWTDVLDFERIWFTVWRIKNIFS